MCNQQFFFSNKFKGRALKIWNRVTFEKGHIVCSTWNWNLTRHLPNQLSQKQMKQKFTTFSCSFITTLLILVFSMLDATKDSTTTLSSSHSSAKMEESSKENEAIFELLTNKSKLEPYHKNITDFQVYKWKYNHKISRLKRILFYKHQSCHDFPQIIDNRKESAKLSKTLKKI